MASTIQRVAHAELRLQVRSRSKDPVRRLGLRWRGGIMTSSGLRVPRGFTEGRSWDTLLSSSPYWFPVMSTPRLELLADLPANNKLIVLIESSRATITNSRVFVENESKLLVDEDAHHGDLSTTRNWLLFLSTFSSRSVFSCFSGLWHGSVSSSPSF